MPNRPYTEITLDLAGQDFLATATVSGTRDPNYSNQTRLGEFTLFDLTSQHLSRNTTHSSAGDEPALSAHRTGCLCRRQAREASPQRRRWCGASPFRPAARLNRSIRPRSTTTNIAQRGRQSVATFALPQRIPVERVSFDLAPSYKANFSRDVRITDRPDGNARTLRARSLAGTILTRASYAGRPRDSPGAAECAGDSRLEYAERCDG